MLGFGINLGPWCFHRSRECSLGVMLTLGRDYVDRHHIIGCDVGTGFHDPQFCQLSSSHRHLTTADDDDDDDI